MRPGRCLHLLPILLACLVLGAGDCESDKKRILDDASLDGPPGPPGAPGREGLPGEDFVQEFSFRFPGTQVPENFVGDDLRSLTNGTTKVPKGLQMFYNGSNREGILVYADSFERLWVHFLEDDVFTPPVILTSSEIREMPPDDAASSEEEDSDDSYEQFLVYHVLFLNTGDFDDSDTDAQANARARSGDALVIWAQQDVPFPDGSDEGRVQMFATYFDRSLADTPITQDPDTGAEIRHGFYTEPTRVSSDVAVTNELVASSGSSSYSDLNLDHVPVRGSVEITTEDDTNAPVTLRDDDGDTILEETTATGFLTDGEILYLDTSEDDTTATNILDLTFTGNTGADILVDYDARRHVTNIGFVSDGIAYSYLFDHGHEEGDPSEAQLTDDRENLFLSDALKSGDPTSFVYLVFRQDQTEDDDESRWHFVEFDLTQDGNEIPVHGGAGVNDGEFPEPSGVDLTEGGSSGDRLVVHNGDAIWEADTTDSSDSLIVTRFEAGSAESEELSLDDAHLPAAYNLYGGDHGVDSLYVLFEDDTSTNDNSLLLAKADLSAAITAVEVAQVDADPDDSDPDIGDVQGLDEAYSTKHQPFIWSTFESRIARDGSRIFVLWRQENMEPELLYCAGIKTEQGGANLDLVPTNETHTGAQRVPNADLGVDVFAEQVQHQLADGTGEALDGIQADLSRFNFIFFQDVDGGDDDQLFYNGYSIDVSTSPPSGSFAETSVGAGEVADLEFADANEKVVCLDAGIEDTANLPSAVADDVDVGAPVIYFNAFDVNDRERMFGWFPPMDTDDQVLVSSPDQSPTGDEEFFPVTQIRWGATPVDYSDPDARGADNVHIFFREIFLTGGISSMPENLRSRYLDTSELLTQLAGISGTPDGDDYRGAFSLSHVPSIDGATHPFTLNNEKPEMMYFPRQVLRQHLRSEELTTSDVDDAGETVGPSSAFFTSRDNDVGIYWVSQVGTNRHIWYQEFSGGQGTWTRRFVSDNDLGVSEPQLVDNLNPTSVFPDRMQSFYVLPRWNQPAEGGYDTFGGTPVFFFKSYSTWGFSRYFVRVHFDTGIEDTEVAE